MKQLPYELSAFIKGTLPVILDAESTLHTALSCFFLNNTAHFSQQVQTF